MFAAIAGAAAFLLIFFVGIITISEDIDFSWVTEPRRLKRKNKQLKGQIKELNRTIELLDEKNIRLTSELIARRNDLPWVNVEELDGPKE